MELRLPEVVQTLHDQFVRVLLLKNKGEIQGAAVYRVHDDADFCDLIFFCTTASDGLPGDFSQPCAGPQASGQQGNGCSFFNVFDEIRVRLNERVHSTEYIQSSTPIRVSYAKLQAPQRARPRAARAAEAGALRGGRHVAGALEVTGATEYSECRVRAPFFLC